MNATELWVSGGIAVGGALLGGLFSAAGAYGAIHLYFRRNQQKMREEQRLTLTNDTFQKIYKELFDYKEVMVALHAQLAVWLFMNEKKIGSTYSKEPLLSSLENTHARITRITQNVKAHYQQAKPLFSDTFQEQMNEFFRQGGSLIPELSWFQSQCQRDPANANFQLTAEMVQVLQRVRDELYQKEQSLMQWLPLLRDCYYKPVL